ncbi:MAG: hypothetical protein JXA99_17320 [Candidatus Lokiarchaeota archaeon]|nr:hypothetical protein [Candidatus Lokiarchaeota archaeon]
MKNIELVFRTIGERTSDIALEFAIKNISPNKIHIIENIKPFSKAMKHILQIPFKGEYIVFMDADCIIMENMRNFLNKNDKPYVDCFIIDKFRGNIHTGVHITRRDVVEEMKKIKIGDDDLKYVLRPESRTRSIALDNLNEDKYFKKFKIFHDFFQFYKDIYIKYALRDLRSRTEHRKLRLNFCMNNWAHNDLDYVIAKEAIKYTRNQIAPNASSYEIEKFIKNLPITANKELNKLNLHEKKPLKSQEVLDLRVAYNTFEKTNQNNKIFCIGLSRTGTKSLTAALYILGFNIVHYPHDEEVFKALYTGAYKFDLLDDYDGISDITVAPYYAQLDKLYPNSKFILTLRDKEAWLNSFEKHWSERNPFDDPTQSEIYMEIRRFLRASVYGTYEFNRERMSYVYDLHIKNTLDYFKNKHDSLLLLNIFEKNPWKHLCEFLKVPIIDDSFPNVKTNEQLSKLSNFYSYKKIKNKF